MSIQGAHPTRSLLQPFPLPRTLFHQIYSGHTLFPFLTSLFKWHCLGEALLDHNMQNFNLYSRYLPIRTWTKVRQLRYLGHRLLRRHSLSRSCKCRVGSCSTWRAHASLNVVPRHCTYIILVLNLIPLFAALFSKPFSKIIAPQGWGYYLFCSLVISSFQIVPGIQQAL